jgi:hypothetical protein
MADDPKPKTPTIHWDDSKMQTTYANVVNVASTREEVSVFFGTNQTWNPSGNNFEIALNQRMILTPFAAKRLYLLLGNAIKQYENRFGELKVAAQERPESL